MTAALVRARALLDTPPPATIPGQLAAPLGPRIGSICSGYRGLDMAVEAVFGGTTAWVADIDPGANRILAHHWPTVPNHGDLTTTDWATVEPVDILCGGYPCQPFSLAGHLKGTADERHLWPHIAAALRVLRPRLAVFENVANHLRLGFDTVLADLADLGFDAEWCTLRASDVGAAHQRNRLFLLAWSADTGSTGLEGRRAEGAVAHGRQPAPNSDGVRGDRARACGGRRDEPAARRLAPADAQGFGAGEPADEADAVADRGEAREVPGGRGMRAAADEPNCGTCGCVESFHDAGGFCAGCLHCTDPELGRPICPADCPDCANESAADTGGGGREGHGELQAGRDALRPGVRQDADGRGSAATDPTRHGRGEGRAEPAGQQGGPDVALGSAPNWGGYGPAVARWEAITGRPAPAPTNDLGRLNPPFVEWLMGLPAGHVTNVPDLSRTAQLKALGNGVVPQQATAALRLLAARAGIPTVQPA